MDVAQMESWLARSRSVRKDYSLVLEAEKLLVEAEGIIGKFLDAEVSEEEEGTHFSPFDTLRSPAFKHDSLLKRKT